MELQFDKDHCFYCACRLTNRLYTDATNRTRDHVIPVSKGGNGRKINIIPCCRGCNNKKGNKTLEEFLAVVERAPRSSVWLKKYYNKIQKQINILILYRDFHHSEMIKKDFTMKASTLIKMATLKNKQAVKRVDVYDLQKLDCNCNDCIFMLRDPSKFCSFDYMYTDNPKASWRINYGTCEKFNKAVSFIPGNCQLHTQSCFKHRKDGTFADIPLGNLL